MVPSVCPQKRLCVRDSVGVCFSVPITQSVGRSQITQRANSNYCSVVGTTIRRGEYINCAHNNLSAVTFCFGLLCVCLYWLARVSWANDSHRGTEKINYPISFCTFGRRDGDSFAIRKRDRRSLRIDIKYRELYQCRMWPLFRKVSFEIVYAGWLLCAASVRGE